jgi:predicted transcriptional regulator
VQDDPELRRLLWYLLGATRGGETRARVISELRARPGNMNQLAKRLGLEYRAVQHHIEVLKKNSLVGSTGEHYGLMYFLSPWMEAHIEIFDDLCHKLRFKHPDPVGD